MEDYLTPRASHTRTSLSRDTKLSERNVEITADMGGDVAVRERLVVPCHDLLNKAVGALRRRVAEQLGPSLLRGAVDGRRV